MTTDPEPLPTPSAERLARNARGFHRSTEMESALRLRDTDPDRYARLPWPVQSRVEVYADLRTHHDRAVASGAITEETAP